MSDSMVHAIARVAAEKGRYSSRSSLEKVSARELDARTDYKAAGLTASEVRDRIHLEGQRQEKVHAERAANRCPLPEDPGRILRLVKEKRRNLARTAQEYEACVALSEAQAAKGRGRRVQVRIGDVIFRAVEEGEWDHDRYSRGWHRMHGPVWTVTDRRVDMLRVNRLGALELAGSIQLTGFRGRWLVRSIGELLRLPKMRVENALKAVQMGDHFTVEPIRRIGGVSIYRRRLASEPVDFCAVADGETYHADSQKEAVAGLRRKLTERIRAVAAETKRDSEVLTAEDGLALGFCRAGMRAFCDSNGLNFDGAYTRGELRNVVSRKKGENVSYWGTELRRMGLA